MLVSLCLVASVLLPLCTTASIISGSAGNVSVSRKQIIITIIAGLADSCTSGFPSLNRIDGVLYNYGNFVPASSGKSQVIIPSLNFTCSGNVTSWLLARGELQGSENTDAFVELQIWRPVSGDNTEYTKIGSTTINVSGGQQNQYPPLPFQAGDILGYYRSAFPLILENVASGRSFYSIRDMDSPATNFSVYNAAFFPDGLNILIGATTGKTHFPHVRQSQYTLYCNQTLQIVGAVS